MLLSMLNSHPQVLARGEVFARTRPEVLHATVVRTFDARVPRSVTAVGCKVFYYHPLGDRTGALWRELDGLKDLHVVHLRRHNVVRTVVSRAIAAQRDEWLQTSPTTPVPAELKQVTMTAGALRDAVARIQRLESEAAARFSSNPFLEVTYEDLVGSSTAEFRRITDFLKVAPADPIGRTLRQNPEPLSVLVENYDDLKAALRDTPSGAYFDEG